MPSKSTFSLTKKYTFLLSEALFLCTPMQAMESDNSLGVLVCMQQCRVTYPDASGQRACFDGCLHDHGFYDAHTPIAQTELQAAWQCCQLTAVTCALGAVILKKIDCSGYRNWRQMLSDWLAAHPEATEMPGESVQMLTRTLGNTANKKTR